MTEHFHQNDKAHEEHHAKHDEEQHSCEEKFLKLADDAWMEILKEKIKNEIEKNQGESLEKLAEIITKTHCEKWKHEVNIKSKCEEYKKTLKNFFSSEY